MIDIFDYIKLKKMIFDIRKQGLRMYGIKRWKDAFFYFLEHAAKEGDDYENRKIIIDSFSKSDIKVIKRGAKIKDAKEPIVICVVRNEIERMHVFLEHYRQIGISKFAIIDNDSTDGTAGYLKNQKDVDLYQIRDKYQSYARIGWINRMISCYGTSHWYIVVDSDELLAWPGMERSCIQDVIKYLDKRNMTRARGLMVDMYPKKSEWKSDKTFKEAFLKCKYFDRDTYYHEEADELYLLCGGPRKRKLGMDPWLTKYPLFRLRKREILSNSHALFPYNNKKIPCLFAILHYKFLTKKDYEKVKLYAEEGNYINGSAEYKIYEQKQNESEDNFNFYYDKSVEYRSSQDLAEIHELSKM